MDEKCDQLGFVSFRQLLQSLEMSKFVEISREKTKEGFDLVMYKARKDRTTRAVFEQQLVFERDQRKKEARTRRCR